jgi:hypothetical protein
MPGCPRRGFVLPMHRRSGIESHDAHSEVMCLTGRNVGAQRAYHPLGDESLGRVGLGSAALRQDGTGHEALTEPADEVNFTDCLAQPAEDGSGRRVRQPVGLRSAEGDQNEEKRPA